MMAMIEVMPASFAARQRSSPWMRMKRFFDSSQYTWAGWICPNRRRDAASRSIASGSKFERGWWGWCLAGDVAAVPRRHRRVVPGLPEPDGLACVIAFGHPAVRLHPPAPYLDAVLIPECRRARPVQSSVPPPPGRYSAGRCCRL
jgi:hypothetical protein